MRDITGHHHLINQARGLCRRNNMSGHAIDLVSASLFQDLRSCNETFHIIDNVIHQDYDAPTNVSDYSCWWLLFGYHQ